MAPQAHPPDSFGAIGDSPNAGAIYHNGGATRLPFLASFGRCFTRQSAEAPALSLIIRYPESRFRRTALALRVRKSSAGSNVMQDRSWLSAIAILAALWAPAADAQADLSRYPDLKGQWVRWGPSGPDLKGPLVRSGPTGFNGARFDPSKPAHRGQEPPLTP